MKIASKYLANARHQTSVRPGFIGEMTRPNTNSGVSRQKLANLGHEISDQTVGNVLRRHGLPSAPARKHTTTWAAFIRVHLAVLAGTDFFPAGFLTLRGLVTDYLPFFFQLESRKVEIAGHTVHPNLHLTNQIPPTSTTTDSIT